MSMSWNAFKKQIDDQIEEKGFDPNSEIWYIDISFPEKEDVDIELDENSDKLFTV